MIATWTSRFMMTEGTQKMRKESPLKRALTRFWQIGRSDRRGDRRSPLTANSRNVGARDFAFEIRRSPVWTPTANDVMFARTGLPLSDVIGPPVVGASNHKRLAIYSCSEALYIRGHVEGESSASSSKGSASSAGPFARVTWGKSARVEAVANWQVSEGAEKIVVHGSSPLCSCQLRD